MSHNPASPTQTTPLPGQTTTGLPGGFGPSRPGPPEKQGRLVLIALALAVLAVILMNIYVEVIKNRSRTDSFTVYQLKFSAQPGDELDSSMWQAVQVPRTDTFDDAFSGLMKADAAGRPSREGDLFTRNARAGEFITLQMFNPADDSEVPVEPGKVVASVRVNRRNLVSVIRPDSIINLQGVFIIDGQPRSVYAMTGVRVAAINGVSYQAEQNADPGDEARIGSFVSLDLMVTDEENLALMSLARHIDGGEFEVSLRYPSDPESFTGINPLLQDLVDRPRTLGVTGNGNRIDLD